MLLDISLGVSYFFLLSNEFPNSILDATHLLSFTFTDTVNNTKLLFYVNLIQEIILLLNLPRYGTWFRSNEDDSNEDYVSRKSFLD